MNFICNSDVKTKCEVINPQILQFHSTTKPQAQCLYDTNHPLLKASDLAQVTNGVIALSS